MKHLAPAVLLALTSLVAPLAAQTFLYGATTNGRVVVNNSVLDVLPGKGTENIEESWTDLELDGADRYLLRLDGEVYKNGKKFDTLPFVFSFWRDLFLIPQEGLDPVVIAVRADGAVSQNGAIFAQHPVLTETVTTPFGQVEVNYFFVSVWAVNDEIYSLRTDGAVFKASDPDVPLFQFDAGPNGESGFPEGAAIHSQFGHLAYDVLTDELYALRRDGIIYTGSLPDGAQSGSVVTGSLPDVEPPNADNFARLYQRIAIQSNGDWTVLRGNGAIYTEAGGTVDPIVDLPGDAFGALNDPEDLSQSQMYFGLAVQQPAGDGVGDTIYGLRYDGRLFESESAGGGPLSIYSKSGYVVLRVSGDAPDLSNVKNAPPSAAIYRTLAVEGDPVLVPIHLTDPDLASDELEVTLLDEELLPAGMTWDPEAREMTWDAAAEKGAYKFVIEVDDGVLKKPKKFKYAIKVLPPDIDPEKNKKPQPIKVKKATALVGQVMEIRIAGIDKDGDDLVITPDLTKGVFTIEEADVAFDEKTGLLTWTAQFEDIGKTFAAFTLADGSLDKKGNPILKKFKLKIKVINALIF